MRYFSSLVGSIFFQLFPLNAQSVDFTRIEATILPSFEHREIRGTANYDFELNAKEDSIFLDAQNISIEELVLNGKKNYPYTNDASRIAFKAPSKLGKHKLYISYIAKPKQTVYFTSSTKELASQQIWTQGQGKYTSHWLPSIDDMNDKIEFDLSFIANEDQVVITNGKFIGKTSDFKGIYTWKYDMKHPMSSYLTAFVIGDFKKKVVQSKSGIPIELYYEPKDSLRFEPTYRYSKAIFDFLETEIGVPYPWQNYKQVPVQDFLYAGMENTTCTIFSNQYVIDSTAFIDKNYVNVNAHEMAHQWFGNLVTEQSGEHHWLHEGFATYYAYLAEKELFGDDHFYWKLFQTARTLHNLSDNEGGEALTNPNANSLTFYEKGAWALVMLREKVGEKAFKKGIKSYLNTYAFKNVTITDFLTQMENASEVNLDEFRSRWLEDEEFPWQEVKDFLKKSSPSLHNYFQIKELEKIPSQNFESEALEMALVKDFTASFLEPGYMGLFEGKSTRIRQGLLLATDAIPVQFQTNFETLLQDPSYITKEVALFKLWQAFPKNQSAYLNALDGVVGLPNKNVRLLWLTLAMITPDYHSEKKRAYYEELNGYTAKEYHFEIRKLAFHYLFQIQALSDESIHHLIQAADHHVWQFKKTSRNLLRDLNKTDQGKEQLIRLCLSKNEKELLNSILNP